ncbi:hypothetical protein [Streptomyces sp. NPDC015242]|uniref:hypothetical protein n=1 Tax=Streptomyces sp. NPDC015242 TaxID=3364951 RepID=UPI0037018904
MFGEDLEAHHLLQGRGHGRLRLVERIQDAVGCASDLGQLHTQGLVELLGVRRIRSGLALPVGCLAALGAAVFAGPAGGLMTPLGAAVLAGGVRESVPHRGIFPLPVTFPGDEMGIVARDL